jgi:hypothetical protein
MTRGGGGQNLIGVEQAELLDVIRTEELLAARRLDGAVQRFTRMRDFGYSKSAAETLAISGHGEAQLRATTSKDALAAVHNTLEHAVLRALAVPQRLHQVRDDRALMNVFETYVEPLRQAGLVADDDEYRRRLPAFVLAAQHHALIRIRGAGYSGNGSSWAARGERLLSTAQLTELRF